MAEKENQSRGLFKRKPKDPAKPGRIEQMREVFKLARKHYPALPWIMLAAIVGITLVSLNQSDRPSGRSTRGRLRLNE
ncbi:hypothetical protein [Brevibacterium paucivorans]